jgi:hypothetical protein
VDIAAFTRDYQLYLVMPIWVLVGVLEGPPGPAGLKPIAR